MQSLLVYQICICRTEDDFVDDHSNLVDTRPVLHDDRLIPAISLRRRLRDLGRI
jgi:hypothetical protein